MTGVTFAVRRVRLFARATVARSRWRQTSLSMATRYYSQ
jgi:hypothetical protein